MDDIDALRRTIRRVGAVLTVALGLVANATAEFRAHGALLVAVGAVLYLLVSLATALLNDVDPIENSTERQRK